MHGYVEMINEGLVAGWAYSYSDLAPVVIEVEIDGLVVATALADQPRPDIERGAGRALAGFFVRLDLSEESLAEFAPAKVRVFGLSETKRHRLPRFLDVREEAPTNVEETGAGFLMFAENLFCGLAIDFNGVADEIVAIDPEAPGCRALRFKSGRRTVVLDKDKLPISPETFEDVV